MEGIRGNLLKHNDFINKINETVEIKENEEIDLEKTGWVELDVCYRVAIQRINDIDVEYKHLRDYIFVMNENVDAVMVEYPSKNSSCDSDRYVHDACDFEILFEDVSFDYRKDIVISLGNITTAGVKMKYYLCVESGYAIRFCRMIFYYKEVLFMAASSITKNFVMSGQRQVERFADAIEASSNDTMPPVLVSATF